MALSQNDKVLASDYATLKAKVIAELNRRNISYTDVSANIGTKTLPAQVNNLITPTNSINDDGIATVSTGQKLTPTPLNTLDTKITEHSQNSLGTDCAAGCMGLCTDSCSNACSVACSNSCTGCSGTCGGSCVGCTSCTSCAGTCSGCSGSCSGCTGTCSGNCFGSCLFTCSSSCSGGCGHTCTGCSGTCSSKCSNGAN